MKKKALLSGIGGMDGSHLADFLLEKDYEVYGIFRRTSTGNMGRIAHILDKICLIPGDVTDQASMDFVLKTVQPDECYHFAASSFVGISWRQPEETLHTNLNGTLHVLEAIRKFSPQTKMYFAASSEMFGKVQEIPQTEKTPFYPRSPYGISKAAAYWLCVNYRESYNMFVSCGICFNHSGERRGIEFVTRKISDGAARIKLGLEKELHLGNIAAKRDWSYAPDMVMGMWLMLQQDVPDDFVLASGITHTVREFASAAFSFVDLYYGDHVKSDKDLIRPAEVDLLVGDASKAYRILGWEPKVSFYELVQIMVDADMARLRKQTT